MQSPLEMADVKTHELRLLWSMQAEICHTAGPVGSSVDGFF